MAACSLCSPTSIQFNYVVVIWTRRQLCDSGVTSERIEKCHLKRVGTMLSGLSAFCCGKSRMPSRENKAMSVFCVNLMVGTMQFCTVTFFLVGWAWSLVWGIYMIILAGKKSNGYIFFLLFKNCLFVAALGRRVPAPP